MNNYYWIIFIVLLIVILYFIITFIRNKYSINSTKPVIYTFKNKTSKPNILIVSGTHGNESGPAHAISNLIKSGNISKLLPNGTYHIVPYVNYDAIVSDVRHLWYQPDINRTYAEGKYHQINKTLLPYINSADLVIDFHEAISYYKCSNKKSVGQTIQCNCNLFYPMIDSVVDEVTKHFDFDYCMQWTNLIDAKRINGTLRDYCTNKKIPHILIELSGQNNIVPASVRSEETIFILKKLLDLYSSKYVSVINHNFDKSKFK